MNPKFNYILLVCLLLGPALACGGGGDQEQTPPIREVDEVPKEKTPTVETPVVGPAAEEVIEPQIEEAVDDAGSTREGSDDSVAAESAPIVYTADGNLCSRRIYQGSMLSGEGLQPLNIDAGDGGDGRDAVLAKLLHPDVSYAAFVPPDGELIVTYSEPYGAGDGDILIWDAASGQEITRLHHDGGYYSPVVSRDAPLLVAMAGDGEVWLWDLDDMGDGSGTLAVNAGQPGGLALSPDGRFIAVSSYESSDSEDIFGYWGVARMFETATGQEVQHFEGQIVQETITSGDSTFTRAEMVNGHGAPIGWLGFSPNGEALLTLSRNDGTMRLWDITGGEQLRCFEIDQYGETFAASFSPDGREIATASDENILIWNTATSEVDRRFGFLDILGIKNGSADFSPDGKFLVTTSREERAAYVWNSRSGDLLRLLRHPDFVTGADASPDGRYFITRLRNRDDAAIAAAWVWDVDHPALSLAAAAQKLVVKALERGKEGDIEGMLAALEEAQNITPGDGALLRPAVWDRVCRYGIFEGEAAAVIEACDTAVQSAQQEAEGMPALMTLAAFRDSRGLARALTGDSAGAITDFQFFVDNALFTSPDISGLRLNWINALQIGLNPFDEATLQAWRDEYE